jgi:hypothetical protein
MTNLKKWQFYDLFFEKTTWKNQFQNPVRWTFSNLIFQKSSILKLSWVIKGWWHWFGSVVYGPELRRPCRWQKCKQTAENNTYYRFPWHHRLISQLNSNDLPYARHIKSSWKFVNNDLVNLYAIVRIIVPSHFLMMWMFSGSCVKL